MPVKRSGAAFGGRATALALAASLLFACSESDTSRDVPGILRIAFGIGPTARATGINVLTDLLYTEPLIVHDADGRPGPGLAESWTWAENGRLLTLRLKPGVKFHDGTLLTSREVAELIERNPGTNGQVPLGFDHVISVATPDASTLQIRLSKPDFFLLTELNLLRIVRPGNRDVGTGPFRLIRRQPLVEARRFDEYHLGRPESEVVQIKTYETHRSVWAALMRGEADAAQEVSRESVEFMQGSSQLQTYSTLQPYYIPLVFNHRHGALRNRDVRQAIVHALDRTAIIRDGMRGHGEIAEGPIWPSYWAYPRSPSSQRYAPAKAEALLDRAGFPIRATSSRGPRIRFAFRCLFWSEDPQYERIALMLQKQLFDIGLRMELEPVTLAELARRAAAGDFDAFLARANAGRTLMFTYYFWRSSTAGRPALWMTGYSGANPALDQLRESTTDDEIREAVSALAQRFREDAPAAFIAWTNVTRVLNADVHVDDPTVQDPFLAIWRWRRTAGGITD